MADVDNSKHVRSAVQKAEDFTHAYLVAQDQTMPPARAKEFVVVARKKPVFMKMVDLKFQKEPTARIDFIDFPDRMMRAAEHGVALPEGARTRPSFDKTEISTELYRGEVLVDEAVFEDNLTGPAYDRLVRNVIAEKWGEEMDEYMINGDTTSADPEYAKQNGVLKATTSYLVNAGSTTITDDWLTKTRQKLPLKYSGNKPKMRMFTSPNVVENWNSWFKNLISDEATRLIKQGGTVPNAGKTLIEDGYWPEDYGGANTSAVIYADPKNWAVRVHRKMRIAVEDNKRSENVVFIVSSRVGWKWRREAEAVKLYGVAVDK